MELAKDAKMNLKEYKVLQISKQFQASWVHGSWCLGS